MGSPASYRNRAMRLSYRCNAEVFVPGYRLAPEHAYPAAFDDAFAAWEFVKRFRPNTPIFVAADSAGGGLGLSLLVRLRDLGMAMPGRGAPALAVDGPDRIRCVRRWQSGQGFVVHAQAPGGMGGLLRRWRGSPLHVHLTRFRRTFRAATPLAVGLGRTSSCSMTRCVFATAPHRPGQTSACTSARACNTTGRSRCRGWTRAGSRGAR